jgi:uncharacterized phage-associated protein
MSELGYDSRAVSNRILGTARSKGIDLTIMQLLKLVYFAHGWTLALLSRPLSFHHAQAWQYGPVFPHIYRAYPGAGSKTIKELVIDKAAGLPVSAEFDEDASEIIDTVAEKYGREHGFRLSRWTHAEGSPWDVTLKEKGLYSEIDNDLIQADFKKFVRDGAAPLQR